VRAPLAALLLLAAALSSGCAAMQRGADNGVVVATTPIHLLTTPGRRFAENWREDPVAATGSAPFLVPLWILEDAFFTGVSAADLAFTPAYIPWDVRRPRLYTTRRFPPHLRDGVMEEAGETAGWTVVFIAPFAAIFLAGSGKGTWNPPPCGTTPYPYP